MYPRTTENKVVVLNRCKNTSYNRPSTPGSAQKEKIKLLSSQILSGRSLTAYFPTCYLHVRLLISLHMEAESASLGAWKCFWEYSMPLLLLHSSDKPNFLSSLWNKMSTDIAPQLSWLAPRFWLPNHLAMTANGAMSTNELWVPCDHWKQRYRLKLMHEHFLWLSH